MSTQESVFIPWEKEVPGGRLHTRRIYPESVQLGSPVLMLHGAIENAGIFYTESGKGLGPFLAQQGFEVYAADLLGRGQSAPRISRSSRHGQFESITREIPAFVELIRSRRGQNTPQFWVAHSWGGVLFLAVLARNPEYRRLVRGVILFGTKRSVNVRNLESLVKIDFFWHRAARALVGLHGYLPARAYGFGSDDETDFSHDESRKWVRSGPWVDSRDGFDYGAALPSAVLPPLFFLAGRGDRALGHPHDVRSLIRELGHQEVEFRLLARTAGNRHDYGHIDMLTHPDAREDHFLQAVQWMKALERKHSAN